MILDIVKYGNKLLREKSEKVEKIDQDIITLVNDMFETMYANAGIGLAAIQVSVPKRLFITDIPDNPATKLVVINPTIIEYSKEKILYEEGCLSVPGKQDYVERSKWVILEYTDLKGEKKLIKATGLFAVCIQHEYDHLEGILFIDKTIEENKTLFSNKISSV